MSRRVLITGGTGFVGSHAVEEFLRAGWRVRVLVRNPKRLRWFSPSSVEIALGSLTDPEGLREAVRECEVVVHCAALNSAITPAEFHRINGDMTGSLARIARGKAKRFVYCSSQAAAGPSLNGREVVETDVPHPVSEYGRSKLTGEMHVQDLSPTTEWIVIRPPSVIGPRDEQFLPLFRAVVRYGVCPIFGSGNQSYSFVCVHDLARALLIAAEAQSGVNDTYFVAHAHSIDWSGAARVIAQLAHRRVRKLKLGRAMLYSVAAIAELSGRIRNRPALLRREKIREILTPGWICSGQRICDRWGFEYRCSFEQTLAEAYRFYLDQGLL